MTFLPIVARELRVASRRHGTYWSRTVMAVLVIIAALIIYLEASGSPPRELGSNLFEVLSWMAYIYCLFTGVRSTADCLSEEKRDGTLGLLFLTDLKGYDVVGGKLVATTLNSFFGLLAIFPVMAIPLLMGGVSMGECERTALLLVNTFFFSLSIGMLMSSVSVSPGKARAATAIWILAFVLGLPVLANWSRSFDHPDAWNYALSVINPDTSFLLRSDAEYQASPGNFWWPAGVVHGLGWACLVLASLIVPRSWQDNPPGVKGRRWREAWRDWSFGDANDRRAFRKRLLDINAFFWLAARARMKPAHVWVMLVGLAGLWCWGAVAEGQSWLNPGTYFLTAFVLNSTIKCWLASEAGWRLGEDRRTGALELLLSTPMKVEEIVGGQVLALKRQFLGPSLAVLAAQFILLMASIRSDRSYDDATAPVVAYALVYMIMFVVDMVTLSYVGMWVGLTAKNPVHATGIAVRWVLVLPWAIIAAVCLVCDLGRVFIEQDFTWRAFLALYCVTGFGVDVWLGMRSWRRLHTRFRDIATKRYEKRRSVWSRLFGLGKEKTA